MNKKIIMLSALFSAGLLATGIDESDFWIKLDGADVQHGSDATNRLFSAAWLMCGGRKFLAVGGNEGVDTSGTPRAIRVYEFKDDTLTKLQLSDKTHNMAGDGSNAVKFLSWLSCGDKKYLASGGDEVDDGSGDPIATAAIRIFAFNPNTGELTKRASADTFHGGTIQSVDWLVCGADKFLAVGGAEADDGFDVNPPSAVRVYKFNKTLETLTKQTTSDKVHGGQVNSIAWLVCGTEKFLAVGGNVGTGSDSIRVYKFTGGTTLTELAGANKVHGDTIQSVDWVDCNGTKYLVVGGAQADDGSGDPLANASIRVYKFDPATGVLGTLTKLPGADFVHGDTVNAVRWLNCGGTKYVGVSSRDDSTNNRIIVVYKFDPEAETLTRIENSVRVHGANGDDDLENFAWLQCGALTYAAVVGEPSDSSIDPKESTTRVFRVNFDQDATNKLLREKFFQLHGNNAPEASQKA